MFLVQNRRGYIKQRKSFCTVLWAIIRNPMLVFFFCHFFPKQQQMRANISGASFPNELRNLLQRRLEDLENQLLKKVNELEEEKSQLYNETVAHRQRTDNTLNSLMNRISELEKGLYKTLLHSLVIVLSKVEETWKCCNILFQCFFNCLALCALKIFPYLLELIALWPALRHIATCIWASRVLFPGSRSFADPVPLSPPHAFLSDLYTVLSSHNFEKIYIYSHF